MANLISNRTASRLLEHLEKQFPAPCSHTNQPRPSATTHRQHPWFVRYDAGLAKFIIFIPAGSLCGYTLDLEELERCIDLDASKHPGLVALKDWYIIDGLVPSSESADSSSPPPYPLGECIVSFAFAGDTAKPTFHASLDTVPPTGAYTIATFRRRDDNSVTVHQLIQSAISFGGSTLHRFEVSLITEGGIHVAPGSLFSVSSEGVATPTTILTDLSSATGGGWNSTTAPVNGDTLQIVANTDGTASLRIVSASEAASVDTVFIIASFSRQNETAPLVVTQRTFSDLYAARSFASVSPWSIQFIDGKWSIWAPKWSCSAPRTAYPSGWTRPQPETISTDADFPSEQWYAVEKYAPSGVISAGLHAYAGLKDFSGDATLILSHTKLEETPFRIALGSFVEDTTHDSGVAFNQTSAGAIASAWSTSNPVWVVTGTGGDVRYEDPPVLNEGAIIFQKAYWLHTTNAPGKSFVDIEAPASLEDATTTQSAYAVEYIYRHEFFFSPSTETICYNEQATPVVKRDTQDFAQLVDTPFVDSIQVTYPETPLDQGSVSATQKQAKVLISMDGVTNRATTTLFNTETIDITEVSTHTGA